MGTLPLTCPCCSRKEVWAHLSHIKGSLSFQSFLLPQAVAVHSPHEAKPFRIMLFLTVWGAAWLCKPVSMNCWSSLCVCVCVFLRKKMCVGSHVCVLGVGFGMHLSSEVSINRNPSLYIVQHVQRACAGLIGWTHFMLHAFACCMNTICWRPVGTPSIHLHCFYAPTWGETICGHSPSDL